MVGLPDILPIDVTVKGIAFSAARRYEEFALSCPVRLERAYLSSELRPIASLGLRGPVGLQGYIPIGWAGPAFAATFCHNAVTLRTLGSWGLKGPELCRAIVPIWTLLAFAGEFVRRFALWAPPALSGILTIGDFAGHLPVLSLASVRDKFAWLRSAQNSWTTRGRFAHSYNQCLVWHSDRLIHIVFCRPSGVQYSPFWAPGVGAALSGASS